MRIYHHQKRHIVLVVRNLIISGLVVLASITVHAQTRNTSGALTIARLKYGGGGDWYNDPTAVPNLCRFLRAQAGIDVSEEEAQVTIMDEALFAHPILFMTGHGRIRLTDAEAKRLRTYLLGGGFLYADDDYGMDPFFRAMMDQVFPDRDLVELPFSHGIYSIHFRFASGLPKIHEHDDKAPRGFGIFDDDGRLAVFYTVETNLSDGWADADVHNDPPEVREAALRMGANVIIWALLH